ncbi:MAG TPA: DUF3662 and FHA domain-containing protein [Chloroflexota bacterium]|nr:DUF3662 and FHA domain-containing protein [Chloroflexota bacterium]
MLARFERLMQQAVEGSVRRVFPSAVQPVQLAKAAARAMEQTQVVGVYAPQVPNHYRLRLAPADLERFADYTATLSRELSRYLVDYARERGLRPVAEPRVELIGDAALSTGSVRAEARFVDLAPATETQVDAAVEGTRQLRLQDLASARSARPAPAEAGAATVWLVDRLGARFPLDPEAGVVRVGRGVDNDMVVHNQRVSRYHAQLRWVETNWLVYDLDSTNGTWVDQQAVLPSRPQVLLPGGTLRLGDHEFVANVELDSPATTD